MKKTTTPQIPDGYMEDSQGRLMRESQVRQIDRTRNDLVIELVNKAKVAQQQMTHFKNQAMGDIAAFVQLSGEEYNIKLGGKKGNVTLMSYDGRYKIQRSMSDYIVFDERLQIAKELIDSCIHRWSEGTNDNIRALVEHAFKTDKEGRVSTARIIGLKQINIADDQWKQAMKAINDSMQIAGTKAYIRIYEREDDGDKYKPIPLDVAAL